MNLFAVGIQVVHAKLPLTFDLLCSSRRTLAGNAVKPTNCRVVVVCAGVSDDVRNVVVWQIDVFRITAKAELQDSHSWKTKLLAQRNDVRSDHTEILSDDRQFAECLAN